jgi:hypothetical protein
MQTFGKLNMAIIWIIASVVLACFQSILLLLWTTDFAHSIFSFYFFAECFILLLTGTTGLKNQNFKTIILLTFLSEAVWFYNFHLPISPDIILMLLIGVVRVYVLVWLFCQKK